MRHDCHRHPVSYLAHEVNHNVYALALSSLLDLLGEVLSLVVDTVRRWVRHGLQEVKLLLRACCGDDEISTAAVSGCHDCRAQRQNSRPKVIRQLDGSDAYTRRASVNEDVLAFVELGD